jgi:hypothetical protein
MVTKKVKKESQTSKVKLTESIWPKITKGTHLTVYTYENGATKLEWDDEILRSEVKNAILKYESNISVTMPTKKSRKSKQ